MGLSTPSSPSAPAWSTASWAPQGQPPGAATQLPEFLRRLPLHLHLLQRPERAVLHSGQKASHICLRHDQEPSSAPQAGAPGLCAPSAGPPQPMPMCRGHMRGCAPGHRTTPLPCPRAHRPAHTDPHLAGRPLGHEGWWWGVQALLPTRPALTFHNPSVSVRS